jgi:hypothetical protein
MVWVCAGGGKERSEWEGGAWTIVVVYGCWKGRGCGDYWSPERVIVAGWVEGACELRLWDELWDTNRGFGYIRCAWWDGMCWETVQANITLVVFRAVRDRASAVSGDSTLVEFERRTAVHLSAKPSSVLLL